MQVNGLAESLTGEQVPDGIGMPGTASIGTHAARVERERLGKSVNYISGIRIRDDPLFCGIADRKPGFKVAAVLASHSFGDLFGNARRVGTMPLNDPGGQEPDVEFHNSSYALMLDVSCTDGTDISYRVQPTANPTDWETGKTLSVAEICGSCGMGAQTTARTDVIMR